MQIAIAVVGFVLGAVIGSYLSCVSYRLPRRISLSGRSFCPACGAQLKSQWNIPIFGWLFLRGRSGCCQQPIPIRYPLWETVCALIGLAIGLAFGLIAIWVAVLAVITVTALASAVTVRKTSDDEEASPPSDTGN